VSGYPLEAVVALRAEEEAGARAELARALEGAALRRDELAAHAGRVAAHAERLGREVRAVAAGSGAGAGLLRARARYVERLRGELAVLAAGAVARERALAGASREVEDRRDALAGARRALRVLERHREGWRAAEARRRERREEVAAEDLVSARRAGR